MIVFTGLDLSCDQDHKTLVNSTSNMRMEFGGITVSPVTGSLITWLPYASDGGQYNLIFPPALINGIPFFQASISPFN